MMFMPFLSSPRINDGSIAASLGLVTIIRVLRSVGIGPSRMGMLGENFSSLRQGHHRRQVQVLRSALRGQQAKRVGRTVEGGQELCLHPPQRIEPEPAQSALQHANVDAADGKVVDQIARARGPDGVPVARSSSESRGPKTCGGQRRQRVAAKTRTALHATADRIRQPAVRTGIADQNMAGLSEHKINAIHIYALRSRPSRKAPLRTFAQAPESTRASVRMSPSGGTHRRFVAERSSIAGIPADTGV